MEAFVIMRVVVFTVHTHDSALECDKRLLSGDVKNIASPVAYLMEFKDLILKEPGLVSCLPVRLV